MCYCCRSPYLSRYWSAIHKSLESQTEQWICPQVTTPASYHNYNLTWEYCKLAVYINRTDSMFRKLLGIVKQTTWISCVLAFYMSNKINFDFVTQGKTYDVDLFSVSNHAFLCWKSIPNVMFTAKCFANVNSLRKLLRLLPYILALHERIKSIKISIHFIEFL